MNVQSQYARPLKPCGCFSDTIQRQNVSNARVTDRDEKTGVPGHANGVLEDDRASA
jgi:hypothetical protein